MNMTKLKIMTEQDCMSSITTMQVQTKRFEKISRKQTLRCLGGTGHERDCC